ncbi:carboxyl transferase domain-containing protein [Lacticaseibacillus absianus]|uniref:carboxyl transferase domain-containing protein n=1 Tax=Lacticaseibacillus absianus TaxID=2729623 RepID=UPI0015CACA84
MSDAFAVVQAARAPRPYTVRGLIDGLVDGFVELHGDRGYGDDAAILGGIGQLAEMPVTVIATVKGDTLQERLATHFGGPEPWGYRKAERLMRQAAKFRRPILTLVNTPGAYPGQEAEELGQGSAIASLLTTAATLPVPMIAVIIGEGGSGGALALAAGDQVWMTDQAMYAVLSPEGFASILWKDVTRAHEAADVMGLTPDALKAAGVVERIVPDTGLALAADLKQALIPAFTALRQMAPADLLAARRARFAQF